MGQVLQNVRVIDLTQELWGSLGTAYLADFGAEVIKLESLTGNPDRRLEREPGLPSAKWNYSFELSNRNKKSIAVDDTTEQGQEIVHRLIEKSDVFATNLPRKALEERGFDYQTLSRINSKLIYAVASGFGPFGPDRDLPAIDELAMARAGVMPMLPTSGDVPVYTGIGQVITAIQLSYGITAAIYYRERTGEAQEVYVSLFGGNLHADSMNLHAYLGDCYLPGMVPSPEAELLLRPLYLALMYLTKDKWLFFSAPRDDRAWPIVANWLGVDEHDPRFDTHEKRTEDHIDEFSALMESMLRRKTAKEWIGEIAKTDAIASDIVEDYSFSANDPQVLENEYIIELEHPSYGGIKMMGFPLLLMKTPPSLRGLAPCLGQHTVEILSEVLGYERHQIYELKKARIIR